MERKQRSLSNIDYYYYIIFNQRLNVEAQSALLALLHFNTKEQSRLCLALGELDWISRPASGELVRIALPATAA